MPQSRELRGVVVPEVDDRAVRRQVERPLSRVMDSIGNIIPSLDIGALQSQVSGLGRGGGGGVTGTNSIAIAQLDVLEDIREELRTQDGGGGGLLTGLGLGRLLAGGGAAGIGLGLGGTAGIAGLLGGAGTRGSLNIAESLGLTSSSVARDRRTGDPSSPLATGLDAGKDTILNLIDPAGIGQTIFESVSPHLMDAVDSATEALQSGFQRASSFLADLRLPASIRNFSFPSLEVPDFSSLSLPPSIQQFVDTFGGGDNGTQSRTIDLRERASDQSLSFSARRSAQGALGNQVRRGESSTVTVESPTLDVGEIRIDGTDILNDLQQQVDRKLRDLETQVSNLEALLAGRAR